MYEPEWSDVRRDQYDHGLRLLAERSGLSLDLLRSLSVADGIALVRLWSRASTLTRLDREVRAAVPSAPAPVRYERPSMVAASVLTVGAFVSAFILLCLVGRFLTS